MNIPLGQVVDHRGQTVGPEHSAQTALVALIAAGVSDACVVDDAGRFLGIITDAELLKAALNGTLADLRVEQLMHRRPETLTAEQTLSDAARLFRDAGLSRVPVLREGILIGLVRRGDVLRWIVDQTATPSSIHAPKFLAGSTNRETASVI